jgi:hypothetical protein
VIEVRFTPDRACRDPEIWETRLYDALRSAGIPVAPDGSLAARGVLRRFDDPKDWMTVIYQWYAADEFPNRFE